MAAIVGKLREFWINSSGWKTVRFTAEKQAKVTELHRDRALCSGRMKMFTEEILFIVKLQKKNNQKLPTIWDFISSVWSWECFLLVRPGLQYTWRHMWEFGVCSQCLTVSWPSGQSSIHEEFLMWSHIYCPGLRGRMEFNRTATRTAFTRVCVCVCVCVCVHARWVSIHLWACG